MPKLKEIQTELKKEIPFKWRVQSYSKQKAQATCVAYIDSRDVQDVLDANCNWSDRYYEENGMLFCEITIYVDGREYKRSDTGSESQAEAQKGHSSDAFKRAAVKFGVGRFLYNKGLQYIAANEIKKQGNYPFPVDNNGKRIWDISKHINSNNPIKKPVNQPVNIDRLKVRLEACKTMVQLSETYKSLSKSEQKITVAIKDAMKLKILKKHGDVNS